MKPACVVLVALLLLLAATPALAVNVITAVTPSVSKIEVGKKITVTVQGNLGSYTSCRVYLMRNTDQSTIQSKVATSDPAVAAAQPVPAEAKFPLTFDVTFDKAGPGGGSAAFVHVWVGTSGDYPCGGQSFPAVTVTAFTPGGPVITKVTPAASQVKVGEKLKVTVDGVLGAYNTCRIYLMLNTDQGSTRHLDATKFPVTFEGVTFDKIGPGPNSMAWIHTWTGTKGEFPCDGHGKDATVKVVPGPGIRLQPGGTPAPSRTPVLPR